MKNKYLLIFMFPVIALMSYSGGAPSGRTGSPGDNGHTCTDCHSFSGTAPTPSINLTGFPSNNYQAGQTYTLHLEVTGVSNPKTGFEMTVENSNHQKQGTFAASDSNTQPIQGGNYITHTSQGNAHHTWDFQWTAPAASQGDLTVYYAVNIANGNGSTSGDYIQAGSLAIHEVTNGVNNLSKEEVILFPNPAKDFVQIKAHVNIEKIHVFDSKGHLIPLKLRDNQLDITKLSTGIYFAHIQINGQNIVKQFLKK